MLGRSVIGEQPARIFLWVGHERGTTPEVSITFVGGEGGDM
jgi:hypothetical protein